MMGKSPPGASAGQRRAVLLGSVLRRPELHSVLRRLTRVEGTAHDHTVTPLELLFDLVFVFAITQVTEFMAEELGGRSLLRGLVMLALLWWAWVSYAWLGNQARADEGLVRAGMLLALTSMFLVALAIPEAWQDQGAGLSAPVLLAVALTVVRLTHLGVYAIAAAGDAALRRQLARTAIPVVVAAVLLIVGAGLGGVTQSVLWVTALVVDYGGVYVTTADWRLPSAGHFAERHGLIVLIALGESLIAVGVGLNDLPITWAVVGVGVLGLTVAVCLWWAYFDVVAPVAESVLHRQTGAERIRLARDSYTYLHFPMVAGIIYMALGLKKTAEYVGDVEHHHLHDPLPLAALLALYGGTVTYLVAHLAFRRRNTGSWNIPRAVVVATLVVAAPLVSQTPALVQLAVLALVTVTLIAFEAIHYADARTAVRHQDTHPTS